MLKTKKIKYFILLITTFIVLYSIVDYLFVSKSQNKSELLNLMTTPFQSIYGSSVRNNGNIEMKVDDVGVALILFSVAEFDSQDYVHLELSIQNLPINYQAKLVFLSATNQAPKELSLLQPDGSNMTHILSRNQEWNDIIRVIGLRISPQDELGLSIKYNQVILVNNIQLSNLSYFDHYFTLMDYWLDYKPWDYLSISHLKANSQLPIYAQPIIFILLWMLLFYLCQLLLFRKKINLFPLLISWLLLDFIFIQNINQANKWAHEVYPSKEKRVPDDILLRLSEKIKTILVDNNLTKNRKSKIIILTQNKYQGLRIAAHLFPLNAGFIEDTVQQGDVQAGDYILNYNLENHTINSSTGFVTLDGVIVKVETILKGENYLLLKVVK